MADGKKLDIHIDKLIEIAKELNGNIELNKSRDKEERISTDIFIKKFGINRKDFTETIKDTNINYSRIKGLYIIESNDKQLNETIDIATKNNTKQSIKTANATESNTKQLIEVMENNSMQQQVVNNKPEKQIQEIFKMDNELLTEVMSMIDWYRIQKLKENIIEDKQKLEISSEYKETAAITRGFKVYPGVMEYFRKVCSQYPQYALQDLMAQALIEFADKYK